MKGGRLSRKYIVVLVSLVAGSLLASGAVEIYSSYEENKAVAGRAAAREGAGRRLQHRELREGDRAPARLDHPAPAGRRRRPPPSSAASTPFASCKQVLPITELSHLDAQGLEQLRVSRLAMDVIGSRIDFSKDPKFREAKAGRTYFGPVYFRKESEPYMTIAMPQSGGGVTVAEVNLKFIWDVVSQIKVGKAGLAYAIDGNGALIAHPDISLVLQKTTLANLAQVKAALTARAAAEVTIAHDPKGREVLTSHSTITPLGWVVFIEQPLEEAFEPLRASAWRTGLLVVVGIVLSVFVSALLARRLAQPIQVLQAERGQDRRRRAGPSDRDQDRRRAGDAGRRVQPDDRPAARVLRHAGAAGGGPHPRADRVARAADGDRRDPAGDLLLADGRPAGADGRGRERRAAVRGGRRPSSTGSRAT